MWLIPLGQFVGAVALLLAALVWLHSHKPPEPTADQRYGCTVAQQAPNGECK